MKKKSVQSIISTVLVLVSSLNFNAQSQILNSHSKDPQNIKDGEVKNNENIEDYLKRSDSWGIVIDSQSVRIYENEKKKNIVFSKNPEIKLSDDETVINQGKKKNGKVIIKTSNTNNKETGKASVTDSIASSDNQPDSGNRTQDSLTLSDVNNGSKTLNYDTSRTINYDDSRTINVDNNRDINNGKDMNKNRDRDRDLRRDLKRDKSRDRARDRERDKRRDLKRDMKRDKNRDRGSRENTGNRLKIKINLKC